MSINALPLLEELRYGSTKPPKNQTIDDLKLRKIYVLAQEIYGARVDEDGVPIDVEDCLWLFVQERRIQNVWFESKVDQFCVFGESKFSLLDVRGDIV